MTTVESLTLDGCRPTPLVSYLKALGILRLISSESNHVGGCAADPNARGWWKDERFHVRTILNQDDLRKFLLNDYSPSPIIAPWNGRAGFLEGDAGADSSRTGAELMTAVRLSRCSRLQNMRRSVESLCANESVAGYDRLRAEEKRLRLRLRSSMGELDDEQKTRTEKELGRVAREGKEAKRLLLPTLRDTTDRDHLAYLDTCYALSEDEAASPLLGSGGNDGSRDFGVNFAERLKAIFDFDDGSPRAGADVQLDVALFEVVERIAVSGPIGQFGPGQGGPNATTGFEGYGPLNAWDVVLGMEGTIVFAGAVTRRWGAANSTRAAFPFTFQPVGAGAGGLSSADSNRPRGEIWTPLWMKPATYSEIASVFAEGRLTLSHRSAHTGLDAARSVARVGQARGISAFERYSLIQPDSKMPYQATPLGRFNAPDRPHRDLVEDLELGGWLQRAQRLAHSKLAPAHAKLTMRRLEDALFQMTESNRAASGTREALVALGRFVGWMAVSPRARETLGPPPTLSTAWARTADDASPEFRVAVALSGLGAQPPSPYDADPAVLAAAGEMMPMACHFVPIDADQFVKGSRRTWSSASNASSVVWGTGDLVQNLISVLERRLVDGKIRSLCEKSLTGATYACIDDVVAFLSADFDDARCAALLAGLIWVRPARLPLSARGRSIAVPFAYAALKPVFAPDQTLRSIGALSDTDRLPIPPELVSRLRAGGTHHDGRVTDAAVDLALARARGSGMPSPFDAASSGGRSGKGLGRRFGAGLSASRLLASLLVPVDAHVVKTLVDMAYPGARAKDNTESSEDTTDGN